MNIDVYMGKHLHAYRIIGEMQAYIRICMSMCMYIYTYV